MSRGAFIDSAMRASLPSSRLHSVGLSPNATTASRRSVDAEPFRCPGITLGTAQFAVHQPAQHRVIFKWSGLVRAGVASLAGPVRTLSSAGFLHCHRSSWLALRFLLRLERFVAAVMFDGIVLALRFGFVVGETRDGVDFTTVQPASNDFANPSVIGSRRCPCAALDVSLDTQLQGCLLSRRPSCRTTSTETL